MPTVTTERNKDRTSTDVDNFDVIENKPKPSWFKKMFNAIGNFFSKLAGTIIYLFSPKIDEPVVVDTNAMTNIPTTVPTVSPADQNTQEMQIDNNDISNDEVFTEHTENTPFDTETPITLFEDEDVFVSDTDVTPAMFFEDEQIVDEDVPVAHGDNNASVETKSDNNEQQISTNGNPENKKTPKQENQKETERNTVMITDMPKINNREDIVQITLKYLNIENPNNVKIKEDSDNTYLYIIVETPDKYDDKELTLVGEEFKISLPNLAISRQQTLMDKHYTCFTEETSLITEEAPPSIALIHTILSQNKDFLEKEFPVFTNQPRKKIETSIADDVLDNEESDYPKKKPNTNVRNQRQKREAERDTLLSGGDINAPKSKKPNKTHKPYVPHCENFEHDDNNIR